MTVRVVTGPVYEPVSLAEAKAWCRIDDTASDSVLTLLIGAMRRYAENLTSRAYVQRSLQLILPHWSCEAIELPYPPLVSVTSIQYIDTGGATQTLAADQYVVHDYREPALIVPAWSVAWPSTRDVMNAVQVNYAAGYAPVGSPTDEAAYQAAIPQNLKVWMQARLATLFEHREQIVTGTIVSELPRHFADGLLDDLIVGSRLF